MLKPGMMLGDRYEIIELVGSGGMSEVYKAKDHKLNRYVAVKVLKNEFSDDRNFVSKFRVEAQSAAGLAHPNIVNVYDVGEDEGIYYIVMEYVEGITLKDYIFNNGRLSVEQALDFSLQIASGIEVAHQNHTIHRDIKPQNIIVSKNGTLKVTDFGIARAATSNTVASTAMGSVHYISPEQARGGYSDEKSDIYSLGITMYEMVTGRVPFEGDNNVTVALMHIQGEMIPPREYYPDIPASFEKVILKCTQKKPERRYLTASALIADLRRVATNPNGDFVVLGNNTMGTAPTVMMSQQEMESIKESAAQKSYTTADADGYYNGEETYRQEEEPVRQAQQPQNSQYGQQAQAPQYGQQAQAPQHGQQAQTPQYGQQAQTRPAQSRVASRIEEPQDDFDPDDDDYNTDKYFGNDDPDDDESYGDGYYPPDNDGDDELDPKLKKIIMVGAIVAAVLIAMFVMLGVGTVAGWFKFGDKSDKNTEEQEEDNGSIEMSLNVEGMTVEAAEAALNSANIPYVIEHENSDTIDADIVISQSFKKGEMIPADTKVKIVVSSGKEEVAVPNVVGYEVTQAETLLADAELGVTHAYEYSDEVEKDHIIRQEPGATQMVAKGTKIKIVVSNGPESKDAVVPDLRGKTQAEADAALQNVKLKLGNVTEAYSDTYPEGQVIAQSTSEGTKLPEGSAVDITISKGPEPTTEEVKTYSATFTGSITFTGAADSTNSYNVEIRYVIGDTTRVVASGNVSAANPTLTIPAGLIFSGLSAPGTIQVLYNGSTTKPDDVQESVNVQVVEE